MADFSDVPESENVEDRRFHPLWMQSTGPHLGPFYHHTGGWGSGEPGELGEQLGYGDLQRSILNRPVVAEQVPPRGSRVMDPFLLEQMMSQFGGGGPGLGMQDPALGNIMAQSPEAIIPPLAARGIMPPPMQGPTPSPMSIAGAPSPTGFMEPPGMSEVPGGLPATPPRPPGFQTGTFTGGSYPAAQPPATAPGTLQGATAADADQGYDPSAVGGPPGSVPLPVPRPPGMPTAGSPLDIRSQAQQAGAGAQAKAPQQDQASNLLKAMQGIKAPPAPGVQNIRSPEVPRPQQLQGNSAQLISALAQAMGGGKGVNPLLLGQALGRR